MQNYVEISAETPMLDSLQQLLDNDKTAISCHAGNAFPTVNLIPGMLCFREDEDKLYQLKADGTTWGSVADFTPVNQALALKANLASPTLTGTPKAPTAASGTNTTQIATTAFVKTAVDSAVSSLLGSAPAAALDTLKELGDALGNDANFASTMTTKLSEKVNKAGDTMTGSLTAPTFIGALQGKATSAGSADTAATATKLATARTINGVAFDGTANITVADSTKLPLTGGTLSGNLTLKGQVEHQILLAEGGGYVYGNASSVGFCKTGDSTKSLRVDLTTGAVTNGAGVWTGDLTGNAASATKLATARTINGTSFNGSANITTANWGAARTLTIGGTGKSVNGSANVSWTLAEIGAAAASHDHAVATTAGAGFMSAEDKAKLNGIAEGANNFSLPAGTNGQVLKHNGTTWVAGTDNNTTYSAMSVAEANAGTATAGRVVTAAVLAGAIQTHAPAPSSETVIGLLPAGTNGQVLKHNGTTWVAGSDANTTYSAMSQSEANAGTATTGRIITAAVLKGAIQTFAPTQTTITGNAGTATKLATARSLTVGSTAKNFDGSGNVAWTLAEIGAAAASHSHSYLPLGGGTMTGAITLPSPGGSWISGVTAAPIRLPNASPSNWHPWMSQRTNGGNGWVTGVLGDDFYISYATKANIDAGTNSTTQVVTVTSAGLKVAGTITGSLSGNATSATKLATARTINGTSFNGSGNITTANWGTARTLTIGSTGKSVNGSGNVSWTLAEIGAAAASHTHSYLPLSGGDISGSQTITRNIGSPSSGTMWQGGMHHLSVVNTDAGRAVINWHRSGYSNASLYHDGDGLKCDGNFLAEGNVTAYSDRRLKKNVAKIEDALSKVRVLNGVTFDRVDRELRQTGLIAQEVQAVMPEAVVESPDEEKILSVNYGSLVGLLVEAIKELNAKVEQQTAIIQSLRFT